MVIFIFVRSFFTPGPDPRSGLRRSLQPRLSQREASGTGDRWGPLGTAGDLWGEMEERISTPRVPFSLTQKVSRLGGDTREQHRLSFSFIGHVYPVCGPFRMEVKKK
ncbi:unnamed protein product [Arctogadus glacialis]